MNAVDGWTSYTVDQCCEILDRKRVPVNGEEREKRIGEIPYYGANGLQGYIDDFIFDEPLILIAEDGGCFDEFATRPIAYRIRGKSWVNNHAHVLRAKKEFDQDAVFYNLEHKDIQSFIVGGTRSKLNQSALRSITVSLPAYKPEQTHKFKDSPLGRIPVEWEVKELSEVVDEGITYDIVQAGPHVDDGVPYIRTGDMSGDTIEVKQLLRTTRKIAKSFKRSEVHVGDIVFALRATVGKVLPVLSEFDGANLTQGTAKISPKQSIDSNFLLWTLRTSYIQKQIFLYQKGTTFMEITLGNLRSLKIASPINRDEQSIISALLSKQDKLRLYYTRNLRKIRSLKTALMQDLLTGRKRVTPLLTEPQEAGA